MAPTYPPAVAFTPPVVAARVLSVRNYSTAELMQRPAAWAVVVKHLPAIKLIVGSEQAKPTLGLMTVADYAAFGGPDPRGTVAAIDADLTKLAPDAGAPE